LQTTGFVNSENINEAGNWSLGLLQMDFFYRKRPWYAGQFVRKITPIVDIPEKCIPFISTSLNRLKPKLLSVLVRNVDNTFRATVVKLPVKNNDIDFDFMESFMEGLDNLRVEELESYLSSTGLNDYTLTKDEITVINNYDNLMFGDFDITKVFDISNTHNILSSEINDFNGNIPYLCASADNNSVSSYIKHDLNYIDKGNCVFIGGKTFVVSYQKNDFFSNDSHNLSLHCLDRQPTENEYLFLSTCVFKSLKHKYSWGDSVSKSKIKKDNISLPSFDRKYDINVAEVLITAIKKIVIKDLRLFLNSRGI